MVVIVVVLDGKTKSTQPSFSFDFDSLEFDKILLQKVYGSLIIQYKKAI